MQVIKTSLSDVWVLTPKIVDDPRGFFFETYNQKVFAGIGLDHCFVEDSISGSRRNTLRGLHYQIRQPQGKLVRVIVGEVFDVAVDIRRSSSTFGKWVAKRLSAENKHVLWIPPGFAHGFLVTSDWAEIEYKMTNFYAPEFERTIQWNDPELAIEWPLSGAPELSAKDMNGTRFREAEIFTEPLSVPTNIRM